MLLQNLAGGTILFSIFLAIWSGIICVKHKEIGDIGFLFIIFFIIRFTIALLNCIYQFLPLQMDALLYHSTACSIADMINSNNISLIYSSITSFNIVEPGYTIILGFFYFVFGKQPLVGFVLNTFIFSLTAYNIYRIGAICFGKKYGKLASIFMLILPYSFLHSTYLYRDPFVNYLLSELFYLFLLLTSNNKFSYSKILLFFLVFILCGILRRENMLLLFFITLFFMFRKIIHNKNIYISLGIFLLALFMIGIVTNLLINNPSNWLFNNFIKLSDMEVIQHRVDKFENVKSGYLVNQKINSFFDIIRFAPIRSFYFLFTPFPWNIFKISQYVSFIESVMIGAMLLFLPEALIAIKRKRIEFYYAVLLFLFLGIVGSGLIQSNSAGAQRHRTQFTWLIVAVCFPYFHQRYLSRIKFSGDIARTYINSCTKNSTIFLVFLVGWFLFQQGNAYGKLLKIGDSNTDSLIISFPNDPLVSKYVTKFGSEINTFSKKIKIIPNSNNSNENVIVISDKYNEFHDNFPDEEKIHDDGFLLDIKNGKIQIISKCKIGLIFGLKEILEISGFRYYMPGKYGTVVPKNIIVLNNTHFISNPRFIYRSIGKDEWSFFAYRSNVNIDNKGEYGYLMYGYFHTFNSIMPMRKYFKYKNFYDNGNFSFTKSNRNQQLNIDNPEVIIEVAKNLVSISHTKNYKILTLGPNDGRNFDMKKILPQISNFRNPIDQKLSSRILKFYQAVNREYHKNGGRIPIRIAAYDLYTAPPDNAPTTLEQGLIPFVAHFDQYCQNHSLTNKSCKKNLRFCEIINKWGSMSNAMFIYEYLYKVNWLDLPWPVYVFSQENVSFYSSNHAIGFHSQYSSNNIFTNMLNYYLTSKALWSSNFYYSTEYNDFFISFYEDQAEWMKKAYQILENGFTDYNGHIPGNARINFKSIYSKKNLLEALNIVENSYNKSSDPTIKSRIDMMRISIQYSLAILDILVNGCSDDRMLNIAKPIEKAESNNYPLFNTKKLFTSYHFGKIMNLPKFLSIYNKLKYSN